MNQTELDTDLVSSGRGDRCLSEVTQWVKVPRRRATIQVQDRLEIVADNDMYVESAGYAGALVSNVLAPVR